MSKVTVDRHDLYSSIQQMSKIATKNKMEIFNHIKLTSTDYGTLIIQVSDIDMDLTTTINTVQDSCFPQKNEEFSILVNCKQLAQISKCKKNDPCNVTIYKDANNVIVDISGDSFSIPASFDVSDFPSIIPKMDPIWKPVFTYNSTDFAHKLNFTVPAISDDDTRPHINTLAIMDNCLISTDGHRLHKINGICMPDKTKLLIPGSAANILSILAKKSRYVSVNATQGKENNRAQFIFCGDQSYTLTCKMRDTDFPSYSQVIPSTYEFAVSVYSQKLYNAIKQAASLNTSKNTIGVKLTINGQIEIELNNPELGKSKFTVSITNTSGNHTDDEYYQIGVNPDYLLDVLKTDKGISTFSFNGPLDPIRIDQANGETGIIMPMRI